MTIKNNKNMQMNVGFLRGMLSKMKLINLTLLSGIVNGMELNECDVMMLKCYVDMNVLKIVNSVVIVVKVKINLELSYGDIIIFGSRILIG